MTEGKLSIYRMMLKVLGFPVWVAVFRGTRISRCFGSLWSVHKRIRHPNTSVLVSIDRYKLYLIPCEIWIQVIYLGFERLGNSLQKFGVGNRKASKKGLNCLQTPTHLDFFHNPSKKVMTRRTGRFAPVCIRDYKLTRTYAKDYKVMEMI
jgi:hypothetical protein